MKKLIALALTLALTLSLTAAFADTIKIGVPDDTTNEARALQLLADNGVIQLKEGAGETATKADVIAEGIEIVEVQADLLVNQLPDLDYAIINSNFVLDALDAGFEINDALLVEAADKYLPRANVIAVNGDNVDAPLTKALIAACASQQVKDYIEATYSGAVLSVVHDLSLARRYGTHALLMHRGKCVSQGPVRDVLTPDHLQQVYGMDVYAWMRDMLSQWQ